MKKILFRSDGSPVIGVGHLVRCSTLAMELHARGCEVHLAVHGSAESARWPLTLFPGQVHELQNSEIQTEDQGDPVAHADWLLGSQADDARKTLDLINVQLQGSVDWIVVDHYALDSRWHRQVGAGDRHVMAIDDLADREFEVQLLLDQNREEKSGLQAYRALAGEACRLLMGPDWALVRRCFRESRRPFKAIGNRPRLLLMSGGTNSLMITKCLDAIANMEQELEIDIIVGSPDSGMDLSGHEAANRHRIRIHSAVSDPASIMSQADLAVSAAGSTVWELACLGVPSLLVRIADNQIPVLKQAVDSGAACSLELDDEAATRQTLENLLADADRLAEMTDAGHGLVDGLGTSRIADLMLKS